MKTMSVSKIVLTIDSDFNDKVINLLLSCGIVTFNSSVGRQNYLRDAIKFPNPFASGYEVASYRSDIFRFYVPREYEKRVLTYLSNMLNLKAAGNGSIFSENVEIIVKERRIFNEKLLQNLPEATDSPIFEYNLITAIVQRDIADIVSRNLLEMGYGVPAICFSKGMGLRQKLGLLRIVIPTDKETLMILVPPSNTENAIKVIRKSARLDNPAHGVVFVENVQAMNVNIRIYRDNKRHAATMDQIITSIDKIHGTTEWRTHTNSEKTVSKDREKYYNVLMIADEDSLEDSVQAALDAGVGGATSINYNGHFLDEESKQLMSFQTKEGCEMVVKSTDKQKILDVIEKSGFYKSREVLEITPINYFFVSKK